MVTISSGSFLVATTEVVDPAAVVDHGPDHEVVRERGRFGLDCLHHLGREVLAAQRDLGGEDADRHLLHLRDDESGITERFLDRVPGEEVDVRLVEEAEIAVLEALLHERQPDRPVRDVRDARDHVALGSEELRGSAAAPRLLPEVLEHVAAERDVELGIAEFRPQVHRVEVADDDVFAEPVGPLRRDRVDFETRDRGTAPCKCASLTYPNEHPNSRTPACSAR